MEYIFYLSNCIGLYIILNFKNILYKPKKKINKIQLEICIDSEISLLHAQEGKFLHFVNFFLFCQRRLHQC